MRHGWKAVLIVGSVLLGGPSGVALDAAVYRPALDGPDRLLTNEFAHANPADARSVRSPDWDVTSGSLFLSEGAGWTGPPDAASPAAGSENGTGSSVFRVTTTRRDFGDVLVTLRVLNRGLTQQGRMPPADTDGIHIFLRWQSPEDLYVVSLNRRDNRIAVKRKSPGGAVNGGTYHTLGQTRYHVPYGEWQSFQVWVANLADNAVAISVGDGEKALLRVVDQGRPVPALRVSGAVGMRGDNCDFKFADLRVRPFAPPTRKSPNRYF